MSDDNEFLTKDPGQMNPVERDLALNKIQATGSPYFDEKHPLGKIYRDQAEKIYGLKYPEAPGRQSEQEDQRGIGDTLRKSGLDSVEKIEQEAANARGEAAASKLDVDVQACEDALRGQWGSPNYKKNLEMAEAIFDEFIVKEKDKDWIRHTPRAGGIGLGNNPKFIELLRQVGEILVEHNSTHADELAWFNKTWKKKK
jgi:hypothetical protein